MNENYFMNYDATTGEIKGFYLKSINGDNLPTPNKEITKEKHLFYMQNQGKYKLNIQTLEDELIPIIDAVKVPTQDEILRAKILKDNANPQLQLAEQQKLNADILLKLAKVGDITNV